MRMTGDQRIAAPRGRVWAALNDTDVLKQCIPGCQSLDKESDDRLRATVGIKVGPIGARFSGAVTLSDIDPPNGYTITGEGQGGAAGFAKGAAKVRLTEDAGATILAYEVDVQVGGRLAQLGGAILDTTAKQLAGSFFRRFGEIVAAAPEPAAQATAAAAPSAAAGEAQGRAQAAVGVAPPPTARQAGLPIVWLLAVIVAAFAGFLIGQANGPRDASNWSGLSLGLLVIVLALAAFEYGRRVGAPAATGDQSVPQSRATKNPESKP